MAPSAAADTNCGTTWVQDPDGVAQVFLVSCRVTGSNGSTSCYNVYTNKENPRLAPICDPVGST